ncbi:MAG: glycoside hydrolase family 3 N-terminal domain-containing protein [Gemmatimonadaceae bacterium]
MSRLILTLIVGVALACGSTPGRSPAIAPQPARVTKGGSSSTGGATPHNVDARSPLTLDQQRWIDSTLRSLSLRERVGQMIMVWVLGDYTNTRDSTFAQVRRWITDDRVGGVSMSLGSPIEVAAKINAMQRLAAVPLLVSSDVEPGLGRLEGGVFSHYLLDAGSATVLPSNMAIGAGGRLQEAYDAGRVVGREARAVGIHIAFAPTVDVNSNPSNPVINTRSFGEDPHAVAGLSAAFVHGVQDQGVAATAKHFPGHGDTDVDSHVGLPIVGANLARLASVELVPFRAAVDEGVALLMTAHIALPALTHDSTPATLVPAIVTGLARDSLHFAGTTITDALTMEGVGKGYTVERSAVLAVDAGSDILLKPSDVTRAIDAIVDAVGHGEIAAGRIDRSVRRILELKARTGAWRQTATDLETLRDVVGSPAHRAVADTIARRALTLLRDRSALVPCRTHDVVLLEYVPESELKAGRAFAQELRAGNSVVHAMRVTPNSTDGQLDSLAPLRDNACVVVATYVRRIEGRGHTAVPPLVAAWLDRVAERQRVVVIAFGNPYVIRQLPHAAAYLVTYGIGDALEKAAARALAGRAAITGRAPISLPGVFARGDGLDRMIVTRSGPAATDSAIMVTRRGPPLADGAVAARLKDTLQLILDRGVADSAFPGAYAVVGDAFGRVVTVSAGSLDWSPSPRPDGRTLWDLASLTKVVGTTTAIMQLTAAGRVNIDSPVQRYLPEWTGEGKERVTVRHLLTHSSGLPSWRPLYKEAPSPAAAMALVKSTPLEAPPGTRMRYSDLGAILLGLIVERVSGESLDAYLATHVFAPLGMRDTRYRPDDPTRAAPTEFDPWRQRHLRGEVHDENASALGGVAGHAGLFSSGDDLSRFARMYLAQGVFEGTRVLDSAVVRVFTRTQDPALSNRALGWETPTGRNSAGHMMSSDAFGHTGFTGTSLWIDPRADAFVLLLTNRVNPTRMRTGIGAVRVAVADAALGILRSDRPAAPPLIPRS